MTNNKLLPSRVEVSEEVLFQEIDGECVLLNLASEQYYGLDEVGTRIWELFSENSDTTYVLRQVQKEYEVDKTVFEEDLAKLIDEMVEKGLVTTKS